MQEKYETPGTGMEPFWLGCAAGVVPWVAIGIYHFAPGASNHAPGFVYGIYFSLFAFINCFAFVQYLQYKRVGRFANYALVSASTSPSASSLSRCWPGRSLPQRWRVPDTRNRGAGRGGSDAGGTLETGERSGGSIGRDEQAHVAPDPPKRTRGRQCDGYTSQSKVRPNVLVDSARMPGGEAFGQR